MMMNNERSRRSAPSDPKSPTANTVFVLYRLPLAHTVDGMPYFKPSQRELLARATVCPHSHPVV